MCGVDVLCCDECGVIGVAHSDVYVVFVDCDDVVDVCDVVCDVDCVANVVVHRDVVIVTHTPVGVYVVIVGVDSGDVVV